MEPNKELEKAIAKASSANNARIQDYTVAPFFNFESATGGHEWIIEFVKQPSDLAKFTYVLDETLRKINSDYDAKRCKDIALAAPTIHIVAEHTFYNWMKKRGKLGGQNKVSRLSNSREFVEDILAMVASA